jgi:hypothetical protein
MFDHIRKSTAAAGLACLFLWTGARAPAGPADHPSPPRVKPLATRAIGIRPWETVSYSPFGGSRTGGFDQRAFAFSPDGKLLATEDPGGWQLELWDTATARDLPSGAARRAAAALRSGG